MRLGLAAYVASLLLMSITTLSDAALTSRILNRLTDELIACLMVTSYEAGGQPRAYLVVLVPSCCRSGNKFEHCNVKQVLAKKFGAAVVSLEHRYYGKSSPFKSLATENLKYLSSKQALFDLAVFRQYYQASF
ncbi:hypothetical protein C3L33_17767, partial [Rhododendron williamsianum]